MFLKQKAHEYFFKNDNLCLFFSFVKYNEAMHYSTGRLQETRTGILVTVWVRNLCILHRSQSFLLLVQRQSKHQKSLLNPRCCGANTHLNGSGAGNADNANAASIALPATTSNFLLPYFFGAPPLLLDLEVAA